MADDFSLIAEGEYYREQWQAAEAALAAAQARETQLREALERIREITAFPGNSTTLQHDVWGVASAALAAGEADTDG